MKKNKKYMLVILLLLVVGISVGYAALTTTLNINGNTTIEKASWDIHFENLVKSTGSEAATVEASIDDTKTLIEYTVTLAEPGDYYEFTVDMVNNGTIDAMISEVLKEGLSTDQEKYIEYTATYSDGVELEEKDYLKVGTKQNIRVRVKYKEDISAEDLPRTEETLNLKFSVTYIQADERAKDRKTYVCRRSTILHTEECTQTDTMFYCSGAGYTNDGKMKTSTITYGNLGNKGSLPASGDAFDCDVNGDGTFDSETERFYYVTDLDTNNDYAVLVYYNNVAGGVTSNSTKFVYNMDSSNYLGPQTLMLEIPTISQWNRVALANVTRNIKDEIGTVRVSEFSYSGYATRFLTVQEVLMACKTSVSYIIGELDACNYLMENTIYSSASMVTYGYWLESVYSDSLNIAWGIDGKNRDERIGYVDSDMYFGARPVIEVLKTDISY